MKCKILSTLIVFSLVVSLIPTIIHAQNIPERQLNILAVPVIPNDRVPERSLNEIRNTMTDITDYIDEQSYGLVEVSIEVESWTQLDGSTEEYSWNDSASINTELANDAISLLETEYDMLLYDFVILVYAGSSVDHWQFNLGIHNYISYVPVPNIFSRSVKTIVVSEWSDSTSSIYLMLRGQGAPTLNWRDQGSSGIGSFCVMGGGGAGLCAYTKIKLGYLEQNHIYHYQNGTVQLRLTSLSYSQDGYCAVRYTIENGIYILIEVREDIGRDSFLSRHGVLVTKVNETAISQGLPGIEVLTPRNVDYVSQSNLATGESYYSNEDGFAVKVLVSSSDEASIVISDTPLLDWYRVDRLEIEDCDDVRFFDIEYSNHSILGERMWAALGIRCDTYTYLSVYESEDWGRNWAPLFNTKGLVNISSNEGKLTHYEGRPLFVSRMQQTGEWFTGICWYQSDSERNFFVSNLSSLFEPELLPYISLEVKSGGDCLYFAIQSRLEAKLSMTYVTLSDNGWTNWTFPGLVFTETRMTNVLGENPPNIYARNSSGIFRFLFNSSELTQISDHFTWNPHCIDYNGVYLAYHLEEGNRTSYVMSMDNSSTLVTLIKQESIFPNIIDFGVWNNSITMFVSDANGTYVHSYRNGITRTWNIQQNYGYKHAMLDIIPSKCTWAPFVTYHDGFLATVHYDYTTPENAKTEVWSDIILGYNEYDVIISISVLAITVIASVVVTRMGNERRDRSLKHLQIQYENIFQEPRFAS